MRVHDVTGMSIMNVIIGIVAPMADFDPRKEV